ncbi:hypothetical protein D3C71_1771750 [compost metagenome]
MQLVAVIARLLQRFVQLRHPPLRPAENNRQVRPIPFNQRFQRLFLGAVRTFDDLLADVVQRNRRAALDHDVDRLAHIA